MTNKSIPSYQFAPEDASGMAREWSGIASALPRKLFTLLFCLLFVGIGNAWGTVLFHETFGNNTGSARAWNDTYKVQSGVSTVYSGASYTITNAKQSKNTVGCTQSGLVQTTSGTDASFVVGPLDVSNYEDLELSFMYKAGSTSKTYNRSAKYKTSSGGSWNNLTVSGTRNASTCYEQTASLPAAAEGISTLYIQIIFNTSNTGATIDEVELTGTAAASGYSITYHCNDATSGCPSDASGQSALPNPLPSAPTKTGFTFGGWYTNSTLTTAAVAGATLSANADLYAKWTCNVTLNRNGATETINNVVEGTALDDIDGTGAQGGCSAWTFVGWSKTQRAAQNNTTPMTLATTVDGAGPYYAVYRHTESGGVNTASSDNLSSTSTSAQTVEAGKPITYTCSVSNSYSDPARIYKNNTFTVAGGTITEIVLTGVSDYAISNMTVNTGTLDTDGDDGTWTGSATSVVFTASTAQTRIAEISVTYSGGDTYYYSTTASCCTALGSINGSVSWSNDGTSLTVKNWGYTPANTGDESHISKYTVYLYSDADSYAASIDNADCTVANRASTGVTFDDLDYARTYKVKITVTPASGYCPVDDAWSSTFRLTCATPTAATAGSFARATQKMPISWTSGAGKVDICYSSNSSTPAATPGSGYTVVSNQTSSPVNLDVSGLAAGNYYCWVRSVCDASNKSSWTAITGSTFTIPAHTLTITKDGGGTSTITPASGSSVVEGRTASITASPATGYAFDHWAVSGTNATLSSTSTNPTTFTMGTANATVTGYFTCVEPVIGNDPADANYYIGDSPEALEVEATLASGTLTYLWKVSTDNGDNWSDADGTNNLATYSGASLSASSTGTTKFKCIVGNSEGGCTVESTVATITVSNASYFTNGVTVFIQADSKDYSAWKDDACVKAWFNASGAGGAAQTTYWLFDATDTDAGKKLFAAVVPASGDLNQVTLQRFSSDCSSHWNNNGTLTQASSSGVNTFRSYGSADNNIAWNGSSTTLSLYGNQNSWASSLATFADQGSGVWTASFSNYAPDATSKDYKIKTSYNNGWIGNTGSNNNATLSGMIVGSTYNVTATLDVTDHSLEMSKEFVKGTVHFDLQGHGLAISDLENVAAGSKISAPSAPSATGYTFGGWYKEPACTNAWTFASDVVNETMTLYAKWTANVYTITKTFSSVTNASLPASFTYTGSTTTALNSTFAVDATNFFLPSSIAVTMGGTPLTVGTDYTYNSSTGAFTFSAVITGNIVITASATAKLKSIAITTQPTTRKYLVGDLFSSTGAVVTATMGDGNTKAVSATWTPSSALSAGTGQTVTASYTENGINMTATTTVDVYSVTVSKVNMSGTAISVAGVTASCSGRTLSQSVGSTNYKFNSWEVTAGGVTISTNTITGTPTGNVTINAKFHDPISVTWKVGTAAASGSPTTEVKYGTKISALPSTPADNAVASCGDANKFMGWTAAGKIEGTGHDAPADLFTTVGGTTTLTENTTYRAVFATQTTSSPVVYKLTKPSTSWSGYTSSTDTDDKGKTWSYYAAGANQSGTYYYGLNVNALNYNIASPDFGGNITGIKMWVRNGSSTEDRTVYLCSSNETYNPTSGDLGSASIPKSNDSEVTASISGTFSQFYIYVSAALQFKYIEVTVGGSTTTKDYITGCCTNLDDLNGEVSWSDPTTAVVSWDNIDNVDSWQVEYKTGGGSYSTTNVSADEVYTKSTADDSRKVTITGLACGTDYTFHIVATPAEDYCNKDQTINDSQLHKYAITLDPANGEVTGGSFIAYSEYECDGEDVAIEAEAATGYEFAGWTITKAGGGTVTPAASSASTTFEMPAKDLTVVASFDPLTYSITYYDGDDVDDDKTFSGVHASGHPTTHTYATATTLKSATKDGYDFFGWYADHACEGDEIKSLGATAYTDNIILYAKWRPSGTYRVTITAPSNGTITVSWNDGSAQSLTSGYADIDENTELTITGTPSTGYDLTSLTVGGESFTSGDTHTLTGNITVAASFSVHTYSITYKNQGGGDFTGTQAGAPTTHTYGTATTLKMPTRVGYTFGGWFTASNCASGAVGNTTSASLGATDYTADITLYAKWNPITYTISYEGLSGASNENPTSYNIETPTITLVDPGEREGYTFAGWTLGGSPVTQIAVGSTGDKTITATWTINQYNVAVAEVDGVTITATPSGGSAIGEGANANVDYHKSVTLAKEGLGTGIYWVGWKVTNAGGDDVTASVVSENTLTVPAYAVTVTAVLGKMKAWCMPEFEITGDVHLTSVKDVYVNSTSTTGDLLTVSGTNTENVTKITIDYLDNNGDVVTTKKTSPLRLRAGDNSGYVESDITTGFSTGTYSGSFSVRFTPTAYGELDNYKLRLTIKKGSRVLKTIEHPMSGRALPEEFVIAVKQNDQWYALPNTILDNNRAITPLKITVNDATTPTAATYAPSTAVYKGYETGNSRYAAGTNVYGVRLTDPNNKWLQVSSSSSTNYVWVSGTGNATCQDWWLSSSDFSSYTLKVPSSDAGDKSFGINNLGNIGYFASDATNLCKEVFLLPITNKYTDIAATVSEWGQNSVVLAANPGASANKAQAHIDDGSPTEKQDITAINAAIGTAKNVKVPLGDINLDVSKGNEGKLLYIDWYNGSTLLGTSCVTIPRIVAEDRTANKTNDTDKKVWNTEVHVLPGATLTIDGESFKTGVINSTVSVNELQVYPGATINVSTGTLAASTLRLRNGWTRAGDKKYDVARVYIADDAALTKGTASMDYNIYELADGQHFYPLAVPFPVAVSAIDYADSWLAGFSSYGMDGQYVIKEYNGARRAEKGPDQANNWTPLAEGATLSPGKGYIMAAVPVKGEAIIRVPLTFDNGWTSDGEKASYDDVTKNVVAVKAYEGAATAGDKKVNKGWNLLGVPFMSCYGTSADMGTDGVVMQGKFDFKTGEWKEEDVRYVNVPVHDFSEYIQVDMEDDDPVTVLRPGWCFFVQVEKDGDLTFLTADQAASSSLPIYAPKRGVKADMPTVKTGIILSDGEKSDKTTFLVSDKYSATEYEINADLEKMFGNGYTLATYSLSGATRLAYNAMSNADASNLIPIGYRAPADGEYTFSINPRYAQSGAFERVDLIDYETGIVTDLLQYSYTFSTGRTQNDTRFALNVVKQKETPTDIENIQGDNVQGTNVRKLLIDGKVYIIRGGQMYDATGKQVKGGAQ